MYTKLPPSASDLTFWASPAGQAISWEQAVQAFSTSSAAKTAYPMLASPTVLSQDAAARRAYVTQAFQNLYGIAAADINAEELTYWADTYLVSSPQAILDFPVVLNQYSPASRQQALTNRAQVAQNFAVAMAAAGSSTFTETQYGNGWNIVNTVTADAATVTAANEQIAQFIAGGGGQTGQTFTFTTSIDSFSGGQTNDTFVGDNGGITTVQAADQVNGGGGRDTFKYYAPTKALPSMVDVEDVQLIGATIGDVNNIDFSPLAGRGLRTVTFVDSAPTTAIVNGLSGITFGTTNVTATPDLTGNFGTATEATFAITSSQLGTLTLNAPSAKSLTVLSGGKNNRIATLTTNVVETLKVEGTGGLTVTNPLNNTIKTIDASKTTGGVTLTPGISDLTFTGGSGNDKLTFAVGLFTSKDTLDGGSGKDTLVLGDPALTADLTSAVNGVKNFETLGFNGASATVDVSQVTAFTDYLFSTLGNIAVTNATSKNTLTLDTSAATTSLANKLGDTVSNLTLSGTGISTGGLTLTGIQTVNLNSTATAPNQAVSNVFGAGAVFTANPDNMKIVVTGNQALTINRQNAISTGTTIDATAFTGNLTASGTTLVDSLTGGSGNDVLTGLQGADILTGGGGNDTFRYINGGGFLGAGDSNAGILSGAVSFDTVADFTASADKLQSVGFLAANLVAQGTVQAAVNASGATTLAEAIGVASTAIGANKYGAFQIAGSTYVLGNDGVVGTVNANDLLVQLTGTHTLTATNFIV